MRHLLEIDDLSPAEFSAVLDLAEEPDPQQVLAGHGVALIFEKPSNRTRNSTEMAVVGLGGHPISIRGEEIGLGSARTGRRCDEGPGPIPPARGGPGVRSRRTRSNGEGR